MSNVSKDNIIIFDKVSLVRNRTNHIFEKLNINIFEASNDIELYNLLSNKALNVSVIIMDIGYDVDKGFEILAKIKEKRPKVPIIILTSNNKRQTFVRGIVEGASDYILKPFEDSYLVEKVLLIINKQNRQNTNQENPNNEIVFDIQSYLNTEIKKSQKGKLEFTVLMITFFIPVSEVSTEIERQYIQVSDLIYENFKSTLWDTDLLERYGSQTFIGMFPYCGLENIDKVKNKMIDSFNNMKNENKIMSSFHLAISTISYPTETSEAKELLLTLGLRMKKLIDDMKNDLMNLE